jgi:hypothetical protein
LSCRQHKHKHKHKEKKRMSLGIIYEKPVLLNRDQHRRRRIRPSENFAFARKANSLYLANGEFAEACKEYAIVFARVDGRRIAPLALLGLREGENLFVAADGRWESIYVPAFVRRYPFVLAEFDGAQMGVCVDEAYAGLSDTEGELLFDANGENTPFLQSALDFLNLYQTEFLRTDLFCQQLGELGLLMEMNAKADLNDGRSFTVNGLLVIDEKRLQALGDAQLLALARSGALGLIQLHLASLSNMNRLVDKLAERKRMDPPPKPPAAVAAPVPRSGP